MNLSETLKIIKVGRNFTPQGQIASRVTGIGKKLAFGTGGLFFGLAYLFYQLGAAAFKGFVAGALVGGTAGLVTGGIIGFNIGVALAPFTFGLSIPVFTALGAITGGFVGATIGGVAGGLVGLGLASGSATAVSMGVGAGIGGTIGAIAGYAAAAAVYATLVGLCAAVFAPCAALGIFTPAVGALGGIAGAYIGAAIGAATGYVIGKYLITPVKETFEGVAGGVTAGAGGFFGTIGSFFGAVGSFLTGAAAAAWNGLGAAVGGLWGITKGISGAIAEGFSGLAGSASSAVAPVAIGVGGVATGGVLFGIVTNASFFSPEIDSPFGTIGDNQFFTVIKTASATRLQNSNLPTDITFTITLRAKDTRLTNIQITDTLNVRSAVSTFTVTTDINNDPISPPCQASIPSELAPNQAWNCQFTIRADTQAGSDFTDSAVSNIVNVSADPEGPPPPIDSHATALVIIGNPPNIGVPGGSPPPGGSPGPVGSNCPSGWPMTGDIQQGPDGPDPPGTHGDDPNDPNDTWHEAIDIAAPMGTNIFSTLDGTLFHTVADGSDNQALKIVPSSPCVHARSGSTLIDVRYVHLRNLIAADGSTVTRGQMIALSGQLGSNPHLHYQFNPRNNRDFPIEPPYIPQAVDRDCVGVADCNMSVTASFSLGPQP